MNGGQVKEAGQGAKYAREQFEKWRYCTLHPLMPPMECPICSYVRHMEGPTCSYAGPFVS